MIYFPPKFLKFFILIFQRFPFTRNYSIEQVIRREVFGTLGSELLGVVGKAVVFTIGDLCFESHHLLSFLCVRHVCRKDKNREKEVALQG